jgi:hypothetical protein
MMVAVTVAVTVPVVVEQVQHGARQQQQVGQGAQQVRAVFADEEEQRDHPEQGKHPARSPTALQAVLRMHVHGDLQAAFRAPVEPSIVDQPWFL